MLIFRAKVRIATAFPAMLTAPAFGVLIPRNAKPDPAVDVSSSRAAAAGSGRAKPARRSGCHIWPLSALCTCPDQHRDVLNQATLLDTSRILPYSTSHLITFSPTCNSSLLRWDSYQTRIMAAMLGAGDGMPLEQWFFEMPVCTRCWTTATVITGVLVQCHILTPFQLFYSFRAVFHKQQVSS